MALKDLIVKIRGDKSDLDQKLEGAGSSLGKFKLKALALAGAITGAVTGAFAIFKKALESTKAGSDFLERSIATAKGTLGGFFTTIGSGNFNLKDIATNMKLAAEAAKEAAIMYQFLGEVSRGREIKASQNEYYKSLAMVSAFETKSLKERLKYLQYAREAQIEANKNNKQNIEDELNIFENAFLKRLGKGWEQYGDQLKENFRDMAANYDAYFGKGKLYAMWKAQEKGLLESVADRPELLSRERKQMLNNLQTNIRYAEAFLFLQNIMKADKINIDDYSKKLKEFYAVQQSGESALRMITRMITNLSEETKYSSNELEKLKGQFADLAKIKLEPKAFDLGLRTMTQQLVATSEEWKNIMLSLNDFFDSFAMDIVESIGMAIGGADIEELGKSLLLGFANILSQLGQMLIAYSGILSAFQLTSENPAAWPVALAAGVAALVAAGAIKAAVRGGMGTVTQGGGGGSASYNAEAGSLRVVVEGKLRGKDIYFANRRFEEIKG